MNRRNNQPMIPAPPTGWGGNGQHETYAKREVEGEIAQRLAALEAAPIFKSAT